MNLKPVDRDGLLARLRAHTTTNPSGCWLYNADSGKKYPRLSVNARCIGVHVVSFELHHRKLRPGEWVLHRCIGTPNCWNPEHLYPGDAKQNAKDRDFQGRTARHPGESNGMAKLTQRDVIDIRSKDTAGWTHTQIGEMFGVHRAHICELINGRYWGGRFKHNGIPKHKQ